MSGAFVRLACAALLAASTACGSRESSEPAQSAAGTPQTASSELVGVHPTVFQCDSITPADAIGRAVGGRVEAMPPMFEPPRGTPKPCDYRQVDAPPAAVQDGAPAPAQRMWSIRYDCRDDFVPITEREMKRLVDAEGATRVQVGAWGVDHRDAALVFRDDDAPCTVRIVGPGAAERLAIAQLVARGLTPKTAPMTPRAAR